MILWIIGLVIAFIISSIIFKTNENIDQKKWHPIIKFLLKTIVWIVGIAGTIFVALLVSLLSGPSNSNKE